MLLRNYVRYHWHCYVLIKVDYALLYFIDYFLANEQGLQRRKTPLFIENNHTVLRAKKMQEH